MGEFDLLGDPIEKDDILRERFLEPPFSVLDTKTGNWRKRKALWSQIGMKSEVGRDAECNATFGEDVDPVTGLNKYGRKPMTGVSIFDPASTFVTDDPINNGKSIYGSEML